MAVSTLVSAQTRFAWLSSSLFTVSLLVQSAVVHAQTTTPTLATSADREIAIRTLASDQPLYDRAMACRTLTVVGDDESVAALASQLGSDELGAYARLALESIPGEAASQALIESLQQLDGQARRGVIGSLGRRRDEGAVETLKVIATGPCETEEQELQVVAAFAALGAIASDQALEFLTRTQPTHTACREARSQAILLACQRRAQQENDPVADNALRSLVLNPARSSESNIEADASEKRQSEAAIYQLIIRRSEGNLALLEQLLTDAQESAFRLGVQAARKLGDESVPALQAAFEPSNPSRRVALVYALSDSRQYAALGTLIEASKSDDADVKLSAVDALATWPTGASVDRLLECLAQSEDRALVEAASRSLGRLNDPSVDQAILDRLQSQDSATMAIAAALVGTRSIQAGEARLFELLSHPEPAVANAALRSLGNVVSASQLGRLVASLNQTDDQTRAIAQESLVAAGQRLTRDVCCAELERDFTKLDAAGQVAALDVAGLLEGPVALRLLTSAGESKQPSLVDAATRVLGKWSSTEANDTVVYLVSRVADDRYRTRLVRALLRSIRQFEMSQMDRIGLARVAAQQTDREEELRLIIEILRRYPSANGLHLALDLKAPLSQQERLETAMAIAQKIAGLGEPNTVEALTRLAVAVHQTPNEGQVATLLKEATAQERRRASEPEFVSLFDGSSLSGWVGDRRVWRAEEGAIIGGSLEQAVGAGNDFLCSTTEYENFELRLQFRLQGAGVNGGVNVRSIRQDSGVASGYQADLGAGYWGALYDEARRNRLLASAQLPPMLNNDWNDYRIRCEADRIRIWLNGTLTVDYAETEAMPRKGIIALQVQANRAVIAAYRNLRIRELSGDEIEEQTSEQAPEESEFTKLFDGQTFAGWHGNLDWFRIENETIIAGTLEKPIPRNEFLRTDREYGDFELRLQFQLKGTASANAGVQIRTAEIPDHHEVSGYQADMGNGWWGCLYDETRRNRVLAGPAPEDRGKVLRENDWNDYRIRCEGDRIRLWINDQLTVDFTEGDPEIARSGIIAVQVHSGDPTEALYRNIRILELK